MRRILLTGLIKIELPAHTVLLCDGGTIDFDGDTYRGKDALFGMVREAGEISMGVGDIAPSGSISFLPPPDVAAAALLDPSFQGCRLRGWLAEVGGDSGVIVGTPSLELDAIIDVPTLRFPPEGRVLELGYVSTWQRLFDVDEGNLLNGGVHKKIYPAEMGMDNTTGVSRDFPWGTTTPRTG